MQNLRINRYINFEHIQNQFRLILKELQLSNLPCKSNLTKSYTHSIFLESPKKLYFYSQEIRFFLSEYLTMSPANFKKHYSSSSYLLATYDFILIRFNLFSSFNMTIIRRLSQQQNTVLIIIQSK